MIYLEFLRVCWMILVFNLVFIKYLDADKKYNVLKRNEQIYFTIYFHIQCQAKYLMDFDFNQKGEINIFRWRKDKTE